MMDANNEITEQLIFITSMALTSLGMTIGAAKKPLKNKKLAMFFAIICISLFNFVYIKQFRFDILLFIIFSIIVISISTHFLFNKKPKKENK
ncbi:hypothetical protein [Suttonella indologenes]|nr:hypothetical protein [Suttonella indologenes]